VNIQFNNYEPTETKEGLKYIPSGALLEFTCIELKQKNPAVTFNSDGAVVSYFNDNTWDFSAYANVNSNTSDFEFKIKWSKNEKYQILTNELKLAALFYFINDYKVSLNPQAARTLISAIQPEIGKLHDVGIVSLNKLNGITLTSYLVSISNKWKQKTVERKLSALSVISKFDMKGISFELPVKSTSDVFIDTIQSLADEYSNGKYVEQALYIPPAIHSKAVQESVKLMTEAEEIISNEAGVKKPAIEHVLSCLDEIDKIIQRSKKHILKTRKSNLSSKEVNRSAQIYRRKNNPTNKAIAKKHGLTEVLSKMEKLQSTMELQSYLGLLFSACYIVLASFTGMRYSELSRIRRDGFKKVRLSGRNYFYISSYETKISGGDHVDYITAPIAETALRIIDKIHEPARKKLKTDNEKSFVMVSQNMDSEFSSSTPSFKNHGAVSKNLKKFSVFFDLIVEHEDLKDNDYINVRHAKKIEIGKVWPLKGHQFRRSLVVNFLSHDLTGLVELKQQLKHIYIGMTGYYGKNSDLVRAFNLYQDKELMKEIELQRVNEYKELYKHLHYGNEHLEGVFGKKIENNRGNSSVLSDDEIEILIRTGQWKVTRTAYSYCTKGSDCDKSGINDPSYCGEQCSTTIIVKENALQWKKLYEKNMRIISSGVIESYSGALDTMKMQNKIAIKLMNAFSIAYSKV